MPGSDVAQRRGRQVKGQPEHRLARDPYGKPRNYSTGNSEEPGSSGSASIAASYDITQMVSAIVVISEDCDVIARHKPLQSLRWPTCMRT